MNTLFIVWSCLIGLILSENQVKNDIPVYWLNLKEMTNRRSAMESHLKAYGMKNNRRIEALTPQTCNLLMLESSCNRVGFKDIAIVCSHVNALYEALHDNSTTSMNSKYFILLEDDVRFTFHVDFEKLISLAPKDFGALQLMMSHKTSIETHWEKYHKDFETFTYRPRDSSTWSAQAVLYNKEVVRRYIDKAVKIDRNGKLGFKLINSFDYKAAATKELNSFKPAIASECLFADMFVYSMAHPSYILNIPSLNSDIHGINSSLHQAHVAYHVQGFAAIEQIQEDLTEGRYKLPSFLSLLPSDGNRSGTPTANMSHSMTWRTIAANNQVTASHGVPKSFNFHKKAER